MAGKADDRDGLERAIAGGLRSAIHDHGPITPDRIGSAVKRIIGNLRNAHLASLARELAKARWADVPEEERAEHQAAAARAGWKGTTKKERSAEMSRRRSLGWQRRRAKAPQ